MFQVFKSKKNEQFYFRLKAENDQVILTSEGYSQKNGALNGVEAVRKNSADERNFEFKNSSDGRWFFNVRAGNNQVIGTSQMYSSKQGMRAGIDSVMRLAPKAAMEEVED